MGFGAGEVFEIGTLFRAIGEDGFQNQAARVPSFARSQSPFSTICAAG
jgi:hypothetical protein